MDRQKLAELFKATAAIDTPEGMEAYKAFAQALTVPILQEIRDASIMRQLFAVERLAPGAQAVYPVADDFEIPVRIIQGDESDISNPKLAARILVALERSIAESQRFSVIHGGHPRMLDHLLASTALLGHYHGSEIHNEGLGDELSSPAVQNGSPESYHAPLVAEFA